MTIRIPPRAQALALAVLAAACAGPVPAAEEPAKEKPKPLTMADVIAASKPEDWRALDPQNTLYLELASGRVVMELAPAYAPNHVANVRALAQENYYDGLAIIRSQDNYVAQWGDPNGDNPELAHRIKKAKDKLEAEFARPISKDLPFAKLKDGDVYAPEVGHSGGFPVARDPKEGKTWLAHCYGMLGAGRGATSDSGSGAELYVVTGHAPRHLDRNVTLLGRVVQGMEKLTSLPRGTGPLGFYEQPEQYVPITSLRLAADVPEAERSKLEVMRTDTATYAKLVDTRRHRKDDWFLYSAGRIELCNVPIPVRAQAAAP